MKSSSLISMVSMIELALMRHFETERENFCREGLPIKTLALFFIDSIESFRDLRARMTVG